MLLSQDHNQNRWLKGTFWPMVLVSGLLHAGLLWLPTPADNKLAKSTEEKKVIPGPKVVRLGNLANKTNQSKSPPKVRVPRPKITPPLNRSARPVLSLKPKTAPSKPEETPEKPQKAAIASPTPVPSLSPSPAPQSSPEADTKDYSQEFGELADAFKGTAQSSAIDATGLPRPSFNGIAQFFFVNAQQFMDDVNAEPQFLPQIADFQFREQQTPDEVYQELEKTLQDKGFQFQQVGTYAKGSLYEVKKGSTTHYISISKAKSSSVFVTWKEKPPAPS
jgi:hypothetical protein